jgi:hypothetical protein
MFLHDPPSKLEQRFLHGRGVWEDAHPEKEEEEEEEEVVLLEQHLANLELDVIELDERKARVAGTSAELAVAGDGGHVMVLVD